MNEIQRQKLISRVYERGEFVRGDDGFVFYWPSGVGGIAAHELRCLADHLDKCNKALTQQIEKDLELERCKEWSRHIQEPKP